MSSQSTTTTDHDEIRRPVEEHDGKPVSVKGTGSAEKASGEDSTFFKLVSR